MTRSAVPEYLPYDDRTQPPRSIEGYPRSQRRTPLGLFIERPLTLSERTGPTGLELKLALGPTDLSRPFPGSPQALGQFIYVTGQVLDEDGAPVEHAVLELWQANASGKYIHEFDRNDAPIDPHFVGVARLITDADGRFTFHTIKPGAYPVPHSTWEWRAPHIHVSIFGGSWMNRLVTQMFFPGEPINEQDLLLNSIPSHEARHQLVVRPLPTVVKPSGNVLGFEHRFVLRGRRRTPTLVDADDALDTRSAAVANLTTGPYFPLQFLDAGCNDLTRFGGTEASGRRILLAGRVLEEGPAPTVNTIVEIWQPDTAGRFRHRLDPRYADVDPGFVGWGRSFTDEEGWYRFTTIEPGAYLSDNGSLRCRHINVMLLASGILRPLVTTVFFGDPAAPHDDPILNCVKDPAARRRLFAVRDPALDTSGLQAYRFDIVLRGESETPFFLD